MLPKNDNYNSQINICTPKKQTKKSRETEESSSFKIGKKVDAGYGVVAVHRSESRVGAEGGGEPRRDLAVDQDGADDSKDASLGNMLCECWKYRVPGCQPP